MPNSVFVTWRSYRTIQILVSPPLLNQLKNNMLPRSNNVVNLIDFRCSKSKRGVVTILDRNRQIKSKAR